MKKIIKAINSVWSVPVLYLAIWGTALLLAQAVRVGPYGVLPINTANVATDSATLTIGQVSQQLLTGTPTVASQTYTTPDATSWCAAFPFVKSGNHKGWNYDWYIKNTASTQANTITLAGGSGVTPTSTVLVPTSSVRVLKVIFKDCSTPVIAIVPYGSTGF